MEYQENHTQDFLDAGSCQKNEQEERGLFSAKGNLEPWVQSKEGRLDRISPELQEYFLYVWAESLVSHFGQEGQHHIPRETGLVGLEASVVQCTNEAWVGKFYTVLESQTFIMPARTSCQQRQSMCGSQEMEGKVKNGSSGKLEINSKNETIDGSWSRLLNIWQGFMADSREEEKRHLQS